MDDSGFDERLRAAAKPLVGNRLAAEDVRDADDFNGEPRRRRRSDGLGVSVVALIGLVLIFVRFGGLGEAGGSRAAINLGGTQLSAWLDSEGLQFAVTEQPPATPFRGTVAAEHALTVRQLLCSPVAFDHVVLFGIAPVSSHPSVTGLGEGKFQQTNDGVFLFASTLNPGPGTEWTVVILGEAPVSGHVAGGGPRMSAEQSAPGASHCFAYDPSIEALKP